MTGNGTTTFTYDGDGVRVKKVDAAGTTVYVGATEVLINATQRITRTYYSAGTQIVAMRVVTSTGGNALYYLHADHLGSTSLTTNSSGGEVARQKYYPYGQIRPGGTGSMPTDVGFTGQRLDATGLMFFQARYFSPVLGRFVSADTIIPQPENPQAWNRYNYVVNNPLKYTDPSGHCFILCTGLIGAAIGFMAYTANAVINQTGFDLGEAAVVAGAGFVAGATLGAGTALIGSAVASGSAVAAVAGNALTGASVGMAVGGGTTLAANIALGQKFDSADFTINALVGGVTGAVQGAASGPASLARAARVIAGGVGGAAASGLSDIAHGKPVNTEKAVGIGMLSAGATGLADEISSRLAGPSLLRTAVPRSTVARELASVQARAVRVITAIDVFASQLPLHTLKETLRNEVELK